MTAPFSRHYYTIIAKICQEAITKNKRADYCPLAVGSDSETVRIGEYQQVFRPCRSDYIPNYVLPYFLYTAHHSLY